MSEELSPKGYDQAIRANPDDADAYLSWGVFYLEFGHYKKAIYAFTQAICIRPYDFYAWRNMGLVCSYLGRYEEAIEAFTRAIRINSDSGSGYTYFHLGQCYFHLEKWKKAIETYIEALKQGIRSKPGLAITHYNLGLAYLSLGDRDSALREYDILKDLDEKWAEILFQLLNK